MREGDAGRAAAAGGSADGAGESGGAADGGPVGGGTANGVSLGGGSWAKRAFDVMAASAGLVALSPLLAAIAAAVKLDSRGPVLFRQERVGRHFRPFRLLKFRTMVPDAEARGGQLTVGEDERITRVGRLLRRTKLDELPQLWNVVRGEMSLVGPRPEVPKYVERFREEYEEVLSVRPGITDLASLEFREEGELLARAADPEEFYVREVLPRKLELAREHIRRASLGFDVAIILRTLGALASRRPPA